ncbi:MAG: hypothetical protein ACI9W2_000596 [Gammaproteobacteria bacterium]|jgi:hypothetical protein
MLLGTAGVLQFVCSAQGEVALVLAMVITTIGFGRLGFAIAAFVIVAMLEPIISTGLRPYMPTEALPYCRFFSSEALLRTWSNV